MLQLKFNRRKNFRIQIEWAENLLFSHIGRGASTEIQWEEKGKKAGLRFLD